MAYNPTVDAFSRGVQHASFVISLGYLLLPQNDRLVRLRWLHDELQVRFAQHLAITTNHHGEPLRRAICSSYLDGLITILRLTFDQLCQTLDHEAADVNLFPRH